MTGWTEEVEKEEEKGNTGLVPDLYSWCCENVALALISNSIKYYLIFRQESKMHVYIIYFMANMPLSSIFGCIVELSGFDCWYLKKEVIPWHLLWVVKPSYLLSCVKLISPVVSSIGLNYFLFLSESRLWGTVLWHREALSWLEEDNLTLHGLHWSELIYWFRCCLVMLISTMSNAHHVLWT